MCYYSPLPSLLGSQSHSPAWLDSPVTHNTCLFPGWRCYLLPLACLATERIKPSQQLPGCSGRCSGLIPRRSGVNTDGRDELGAQTVPDPPGFPRLTRLSQIHQAFPDSPGDHESPLTLMVRQGLMVVMGWAAAPEGIPATAADHEEGERSRLFSCALIFTDVSSKFTQSSSMNTFLGPPNELNRVCQMCGPSIMVRR